MSRLVTLEREVEVHIGEQTFSKVEGVGHVVRSWPINIMVDGQRVENIEREGEFIRMHLDNSTYLWNAPLDDYDPEMNSHDINIDARWEVE